MYGLEKYALFIGATAANDLNGDKSILKEVRSRLLKSKLYYLDDQVLNINGPHFDRFNRSMENIKVSRETQVNLKLPNGPIFMTFNDSVNDNIQSITLGIMLDDNFVARVVVEGTRIRIDVMYDVNGWQMGDEDILINYRRIMLVNYCINMFKTKIANMNNIGFRKTYKFYDNKKVILPKMSYLLINEIKDEWVPFIDTNIVSDYLYLKNEFSDTEVIDQCRLYEINIGNINQYLASIDYENKYKALLDINCPHKVKQHQYIVDHFNFNELGIPHDFIYVHFKYSEVRPIWNFNGFIIGDGFLYIHLRDDVNLTNDLFTIFEDGCLKADSIFSSVILIIIRGVMLYINSFDSNMELFNNNRQSKANKSKASKENIIPDYYYEVSLRKRKVPFSSKLFNFMRKKCDYAYDVKGHYVYRINKGKVPLDAELESKLRKDERRRIFYSKAELSINDLQLLEHKGVELSDDEWVSILRVPRKGHIANSNGGKNPYIPSVHTD